MQLVYGSYYFPLHMTALHVYKQNIYSPRGARMEQKVLWDVIGWMKSDTSIADLTSQLQGLESGTSADGGNLSLLDNNGAATVHQINSSSTLNGIQVIGPVHYPGGNPGVWGMGTEYVNMRTFRLKFQAEILDSTDNLVFYQASLTRIGTGGNRNVWSDSFTGVPIPQTTRQYTKCVTIQQGRSVGLTSYETVDAPLFGDPYFQNEKALVEYDSPQRVTRNQPLMYPLRWRYVYESAVPL